MYYIKRNKLETTPKEYIKRLLFYKWDEVVNVCVHERDGDKYTDFTINIVSPNEKNYETYFVSFRGTIIDDTTKNKVCEEFAFIICCEEDPLYIKTDKYYMVDFAELINFVG